LLGALLLGPKTSGDAYGSIERDLLRQCAEQLTLMIENARLTSRVVEQEKLRRDVALAAEVQRRLLPDRPPEREGSVLAALSLPARSVGGDYYDFLDLGDQRIGIALADIAGKGVAAALIMAVVQASLRIVVSGGETSLPELAAKMNGFLHRSTGSNSYATFFYAQLDERSRQLRYVNAGHNPPYLLRAADESPHAAEIRELSIGGTVLGLFPQMTYEEATVDLRSGDVLVAFTDGVTEALNLAEEEFGEERLKDLLRSVVHLPADDISASISTTLRDWIKDTTQFDDLTFVVMKVN
jgi:phosphoserine phosphatase RsbU/P